MGFQGFINVHSRAAVTTGDMSSCILGTTIFKKTRWIFWDFLFGFWLVVSGDNFLRLFGVRLRDCYDLSISKTVDQSPTGFLFILSTLCFKLLSYFSPELV